MKIMLSIPHIFTYICLLLLLYSKTDLFTNIFDKYDININNDNNNNNNNNTINNIESKTIFNENLDFLDLYDLETLSYITKLTQKFRKIYNSSLGKPSNLYYSNYRKHSHIVQKLDTIRKEIIVTLENTVYTMNEYDFTEKYKIPEIVNRLNIIMEEKLNIICYHLGLRSINYDIEYYSNNDIFTSEFRPEIL